MVGIDIVYLKRIKLEETFIHYILEEDEIEIFKKKINDKQRIDFLGGRFAAKEAIYKATQDIHYLHYSILNDEKGKPFVKNHPELSLSISHDGDYAIAMVLVKE